MNLIKVFRYIEIEPLGCIIFHTKFNQQYYLKTWFCINMLHTLNVFFYVWLRSHLFCLYYFFEINALLLNTQVQYFTFTSWQLRLLLWHKTSTFLKFFLSPLVTKNFEENVKAVYLYQTWKSDFEIIENYPKCKFYPYLRVQILSDLNSR